MRWYDWLMFGAPPLALLVPAIWVSTVGLPAGALVAMWGCWAGFTFILVRLAWPKIKGK